MAVTFDEDNPTRPDLGSAVPGSDQSVHGRVRHR
jgi:hypothetical protein